MRSLFGWLADMFLGPSCPYRCGTRSRGLVGHVEIDHAGDTLPPRGRA